MSKVVKATMVSVEETGQASSTHISSLLDKTCVGVDVGVDVGVGVGVGGTTRSVQPSIPCTHRYTSLTSKNTSYGA